MMERKPPLGNRTLLIIVSVVTIILLAGSAILQRIVFKAAEVNSSVFLEGSAVLALPQTDVTYNVRANLTGEAVIAAGQFVTSFDPSYLQFVEATPTASWQTSRLLIETSGSKQIISWAVLPGDDQGKVLALNGPVSFGQLKFRSLKVGLTNLSLNQAGTLVVGIDNENRGNLYNAVSSVQDAQLTITQTLPSVAPTPTPPPLSTVPPPTIGTTQRILADEAVAATDQAIVFVGLKYNGLITVRFGTDSRLLTKVEAVSSGTNQAVGLAGLLPNTQYYYQVAVFTTDQKSSITGQVKSFRTGTIGTGPVDRGTSSFKIFPSIAKDSTQLYLFLRNSAGQLVTTQPVVSVDDGSASVSLTTLAPGLHLAAVRNSLASKQKVTAAISVGGQKLADQSVLFDPNLKSVDQPTISQETPLAWDSLTLATLAALIVLFLFSALAFVKLSRVK